MAHGGRLRVGEGCRPSLDKLTREQRKELLQAAVKEVIVNRNDKVDITLAIPKETEPTGSIRFP